eukprot:scaffold1569_cov171-Amphora_coffeaeformis.AAC.4
MVGTAWAYFVPQFSISVLVNSIPPPDSLSPILDAPSSTTSPVASSSDVDDRKIWLPGATGSGPYNVANAWMTAFSAIYPETLVTLTSVGSGAAQESLWGDIDCENKPVEAICNAPDEYSHVKETIWGLGDAPINENVYEDHPTRRFQQLPACAGAIAIVYSKEENDSEPLNMTFDVLSAMFNRTITYWDDPNILSLNPFVRLPHEPIAFVVREDSSGQTSIVTDAMDHQVPSWPDSAVGKQPDWPLGFLKRPTEISRQQTCDDLNRGDNEFDGNVTHPHYKADGKTGVALGMLRVPYSIGYMEIGYAATLTDFLGQITIQGARPNADSLRAAMEASASQLDPQTLELNLARADNLTDGAYPIAGYAYWYLKRNETEFSSCYQAWLVCKFVEWSYTDPQAADLALQNGWVVPPLAVVERTLERLQEVMCIDTEQRPFTVISALSYTPPPYRPPKSKTNFSMILSLTVGGVIIGIVLILREISYRRRNGDHLWKIHYDDLVFGDPPEVIGRGSFGTVMLADYRGTRVAVKRASPSTGIASRNSPFETLVSLHEQGTNSKSMKKNSVTSGTTRHDFIREIRVLSRLRHPFITTIMGAILEKNREPMLVMEYMEKGSLYDILHNMTTVLDKDLQLRILQDIVQGVRFLHSAEPAVIHGDLKAKNILINKNFQAKVSDFGLSHRKMRKGGVCGTEYWMAPELLLRQSPNTTASDMYALGIILYEIYSREDPYEDEKREEVLKKVKDRKVNKRPPFPASMPPEIKTMMKECLHTKADERPSAEELDKRLKRIGPSSESTCVTEADDGSNNSDSFYDMVPRHIREALKEGRKVEPEFKTSVAILFSNVVDYADITSKLEPRKVTRLLERLFRAFDFLCEKYDVFKVETIGDAYMAVTNLVRDQSDDYVKRIALFAIDAVKLAKKIPIDPENLSLGNISIRVGFHTGSVVADVVGRTRPRYSLFGDSVNIASQMESSSLPNKIQCTRKCYTLLRAQLPSLQLAMRGQHTNVEGKGGMITYWVEEEFARDSLTSKKVNFASGDHSMSSYGLDASEASLETNRTYRIREENERSSHSVTISGSDHPDEIYGSGSLGRHERAPHSTSIVRDCSTGGIDHVHDNIIEVVETVNAAHSRRSGHNTGTGSLSGNAHPDFLQHLRKSMEEEFEDDLTEEDVETGPYDL